jgi:predicted Zn-dependent protease
VATPLIAAACLADVASVSGQAARAYALLRRSLNAAPDADAAVRLWALTVLAEVAVRADDLVAAEQDFRAALALGIRDAYLLGAYADFLLDRGRADEARDLLAEETRAESRRSALPNCRRMLPLSPLVSTPAACAATRCIGAKRRGSPCTC